jgi:hypothetical protein
MSAIVAYVCTTLSRKYPTLFFPAVSNGDRAGKLSIVVEGTFMCMCDFLLPRNAAGYICCRQIAKWCNTCSSHYRFARDDRVLRATILHQVLSETWDTQEETVRKIQQAFSDDAGGGGGRLN